MENAKTNHSYLPKIVIVVALILAAITFAQTPVITYVQAENVGKYVKEYIMISANDEDHARRNIKGTDYILISDPIYEGKSNTYLAYIPTNNGAEAITDVKAMNMHGGWSYDEYQTYINEMKAETKKTVSMLMVALNEFRAEYKKNPNKENIKIAYDILNMIKDTDLEKDNSLAEIMLKDDFTEDKFAEYYLQGNPKMVGMIETALLIACSFTNETNFIKNLDNFDWNDDYESSQYAEYSKTILGQLRNLNAAVKSYINSGITAEKGYTEEEMEEYMYTIKADPGYDPDFDDNGGLHSAEENQYLYSTGASLYGLIKNVPYATNKNNNVHTLLGFIASDVDIYAIEDFYPLISGMSDGQRALIASGLDLLIFMAFDDINSLKARYEQSLKDAEIDGNTEFDLYYDVNRRIFNPDGIAMTSEALADAAQGKTDWARDPHTEADAVMLKYNIAMITIAGAVVVGIGIAMGISFGLSLSLTQSFVWQDLFLFGGTSIWPAIIVFAVIIVVALIAIVILLALRIEYEKGPDSWLEIPEIMCSKEVSNGKTRYVYYDNISIIGRKASDVGQEETFNDYDRQWLALYTTKDTRMGKPILADSIVISNTKPRNTVESVRIFNKATAQNLCEFSASSEKVYMSFKRDSSYVASSSSKTGSVFSQASSWGFAAAGLALGLVGGTVIGIGTKRKKADQTDK